MTAKLCRCLVIIIENLRNQFPACMTKQVKIAMGLKKVQIIDLTESDLSRILPTLRRSMQPSAEFLNPDE